MFTAKQLCAMLTARRYSYVRTAHVKTEFLRRDLLKKDPDSAVTRGVLRQLEKQGYLRRHEPRMVDPRSGGVAPILVPTIKGASALAQELNDCKYLLAVEPNFKDWMSLNHHCEVTSLHQIFDEALDAQDYVKLHTLAFEHECICPDAEDMSKKYRLHTTVSTTPRVVCCPDSLLEIEVKKYRRVLYVEYETGSDGSPARVAAKKHKGYHGLAKNKLFQRHCPDAQDFRVLVFCPYASFRDNLRREMKKLPGAELWFFCDTTALTAANFLHGDIFYGVEAGPFPLVKAPVPAALPAASPVGGR